MANTSRYKLIVQDESGFREFALGPDPAVVGRSPENTVCIDHGSISRRHSEFRFSPEGVEVRDLSSSNGTFVNGKKIDRQIVKMGDEVKFGQVVARLFPGPEEPDPEPEGKPVTQEPVSQEPVSNEPVSEEVELGEISLETPSPAVAAPAETSDYTLIIAEGENAGDRYPLGKERVTLGRSGSNPIQIKGLGISGTHAEIVWEGDVPILRDLDSTNGILHGGSKVLELGIKNGLAVHIGKVAIRFEGPADEIQIGMEEEAPPPVSREEDETLQFRHLSETEVPARRRMAIPALALLVLAVAAATYFFLQPTSSKNLGGGNITAPTDSLLVEGFSAEETDAVDMWPLEDAGGGELTRSAAALRTGRFGYILARAEDSDPTRLTLALHRTSFQVDGRRRYSLTGAVRRADGAARATLMLRFLGKSGEIIQEVYGPWITGETYEAVEISPTVPEGCTAARVGLAALGGGGSIHFDDIVLKPSNLTPLLVTHPCNRFTIEISPHGSWSLRDDSRWVLSRFEYFLVSGKNRFSQTLCTRPSGAGPEKKDGVTRFRGRFQGPEGTGDPKEIGWTAQGADEVTFAYQAWPGTGAAREGISFHLRKEDLKQGLLVQAGTEVTPQSGSFSIEGCNALVIGSGARPIRFVFEASLDIDLRVMEDTVKVDVSRVSGSGNPIQLKLQTSLIDLMAGATTALSKGREALGRERFGEAFRQLNRVLREFPVKRENVEEAKKLIQQVRQRFAEQKDGVQKRAEDAVAFKDRVALARVLEEAKALQATYRDTPVESEASVIVERLRSALKTATTKEMEAFARKYLLLARDFKDRGDVHLAGHYYKTVIERCKGTPWAATAVKENDDMNKVVKDVEKTKNVEEPGRSGNPREAGKPGPGKNSQ